VSFWICGRCGERNEGSVRHNPYCGGEPCQAVSRNRVAVCPSPDYKLNIVSPFGVPQPVGPL
jgi:hypothetical protein